MVHFAIMASGQGTNAKNIIRYFNGHHLAKAALVVSNKKGAPVLEKARAHNVPAVFCHPEEFKGGGAKVLELLENHNIQFIVLAGFLLLVPPAIIHTYKGRIINIHPALLPSYGGKGMYGEHVHRAVIENGESNSGITIHYVDEAYDEGRIIFQASCSVAPEETPASLAKKIHQLEYQHYPPIIEEVIKQHFP